MNGQNDDLHPRSDAATGIARRHRRALLWGTLVALLLVAQTLLFALTIEYEATRQQDRADGVAGAAAAEVRQSLVRDLQSLQALLWDERPVDRWRAAAAELLRQRRTLLRLEQRDAAFRIVAAVDTPYRVPPFGMLARNSAQVETELACSAAQRMGATSYSRSYFVPQLDGLGIELLDVCLPAPAMDGPAGFMTATISLTGLLEAGLGTDPARIHELTFVEGDGTRLARVGAHRGAGVYVAERLIDLPGLTLRLRADSSEGRPRLIPNLTLALVLGLSLALFGVVIVLLRDVRRRARAEGALAEALAFRKAMEDSLVTGLRARDPQGRITYANPAFCAMVGFTIEELLGAATPPYWPPELAGTYAGRQQNRLSGQLAQEAREGFETLFMRKNGERFPVMIYEAPLVDGAGRHTGWMSAVLDISAQRRVEELSRQQQERLQASARLATVGEMASLLSHELNQPLSAIASYATGSLNLLEQPDEQTPQMVQQALRRIAEQAERAGRVIQSVHAFVRRRDRAREAISALQVIDAVLPLVRLQARKSGTLIELDVPKPVPRVVCDRTMVEQVLLNLTRNGIQAMDPTTPPEQRVLTLRVRQSHARWVTFSVIDRGAGIAPEVAQRLFTPFFTTRPEGMGLGLSLCRTVIEQHGGALDFETRLPGEDGAGGCTEFRFTLPAEMREIERPVGSAMA